MYILRWFSHVITREEAGELRMRLSVGCFLPALSGRSRGRAEGLLGLKEGVVRLSQTTGGPREKKIAIQYYNVVMSLL